MPAQDQSYKYSISQATQLLQVSTQMLRKWEREGSIAAPNRDEKGNRYYTLEDIEKLEQYIKYRGSNDYVVERNTTLKTERERYVKPTQIAPATNINAE